jgi:hypothetical protein
MSELDVGCENEGALLLPKSQQSCAAFDLPGATAPMAGTRVKTLRPIFMSVAMFMIAIALTVPTRPKLILAAAGGDVSKASYFTGVVDGKYFERTVWFAAGECLVCSQPCENI